MSTILVIDDDATLLGTMERALQAFQFKTLTAENGVTGLALAKAHAPDLIISDIRMDLGDGFSLLESLRTNPATAAIPVILMTGQAPGLSNRRSMDSGADDYLSKPFTNHALMSSIKARLERNAAVRAPTELRYRILFESAQDAIMLVQEGRCIDCNPSALRIFQCTREQMLGRAPNSFSPPYQADGRSSQEQARHWIEAALNGAPQRFEWTHVRSNLVPFEAEVILNSLPLGEPPVLMAIIRDISERKQFERSIAQSKDQLSKLLDRLQSVAEDERTRLSRDLHDHLGQLLTALQLELGGVERRIVHLAESKEKAELIEKVSNSKLFALQTHQSVRQIASELRPLTLDEDFPLTVRNETLAFEKRTEGIHCEVILPQNPPALNRKQKSHLFRILQESLTNIALHARADQVCVRLEVDNDNLTLQVTDNGVGIPKSALSQVSSLGLLSIRERAAALSGDAVFEQSPAKGTRMTVTIPFHRSKNCRSHEANPHC